MEEHSPQVKCVSHVSSVRAEIPLITEITVVMTQTRSPFVSFLHVSLGLLSWYALPSPPLPPCCHAMSMLSGSCMDTMSSTVLVKASITVHTQSALNTDTSSLSSFFTFSPFFHLSPLFNVLLPFHHRAGSNIV